MLLCIVHGGFVLKNHYSNNHDNHIFASTIITIGSITHPVQIIKIVFPVSTTYCSVVS